MRDVHAVFTEFKEEFPEVAARYAALGEEIHERSGPLPAGVRWLVKVAASAASGHHRALETHLARAREAGVSEDEILHALLLLIPTCGFPCFMEAYRTVRRSGPPS